MTEVITDAQVAAVLRVFVRGCGPVVQRMRDEEEPGGGGAKSAVGRGLVAKARGKVAPARFPGSDAWARMDADERSGWWVGRVGRLTALVTSFTGLTGLVGERVPLQDVIGSAGQGLLLCALASERGIDDVGTRVRLLGSVLFGRDIDPVVAAGSGGDEEPAGDAVAVPEDTAGTVKLEPAATAVLVWRQGRMLTAVRDELEKRPQGRAHHRALRKLPVLGMAGSYLGEREALQRCAENGARWIAAVSG